MVQKSTKIDIPPEPKTPKTLNLWGGTSLIVGCIIGTGVFSNGSSILQSVRSPGMAMVIWVFGAIVAYCGGFSYTEWGLMIPESGGDTPYLEYVYKKPKQLAAFMYCWCRVFLAHPGATAALSTVTGDYFFKAFPLSPSLLPYKGWLIKSVAIAVLASIWVLCAFSNRIATRATSGITFLKILIVMFVALSGIAFSFGAFPSIVNPNNFKSAFSGSSTDPTDYASALLQVFFCYEGWSYLSSAMGELQDPERNIPRSIVGGVSIVAILYILTNLSYLLVLPVDVIISSGSTLGATFTSTLYGPIFGGKVLPFLILISAYGSGLATTFASSRIAMEAAKRGFLPFSERLSKSHQNFETPWNALTFHCLVTSIYILSPPSGDSFFFLVNLCCYGTWLFYTLTVLGLVILRRKEPEKLRPFKTWMICPVVIIVTGLFLSVFPFFQTQLRISASLGLGAVLLGLPVWYWKIYRYQVREPLTG